MTRDPIGFAGGLNLYAYCGNDPVSGIDPEGFCGGSIWSGWGAFFDSSNWDGNDSDHAAGIIDGTYHSCVALAVMSVAWMNPIGQNATNQLLAYNPGTAMYGGASINRDSMQYSSGDAVGKMFVLLLSLVAGGGEGSGKATASEGSTATAVIEEETLAQVTVNRANGLNAEARALKDAGIVVGKKKMIPSLTKTATGRFPDGLNKQFLVESKSVNYIGYTNQIRDSQMFASQNNLEFVLYVRKDTSIAFDLMKQISNGNITLRIIP